MRTFEKYVNEMNTVLNERSINKIQAEFTDVVNKMAILAKEFAATTGDEKANILAELKGLTSKKNDLLKEIDAAVAGKDRDVQLAIKESEVNEKVTKATNKYKGLTYTVYYEAPKGYSINGVGELKGVVGSPEFFDTENEAEEYAEEQIKDYLGESVVSEANPFAKPAGLSKEETLVIAQKFADAMSKAEGAKVTVNKRTLEEDSFDLDYDGEEFDGGSYNIFQNGNVMNMGLPNNPVYGRKNDSVDTIAKNMKKFMSESIVTEGSSDGGKMAKTHVVYAMSIQLKDGSYLGSYRVSVKKGDDAEDRAKELAKQDLGKNLKAINSISKALNPELANVTESIVTEARHITVKRQYTGNYPATTVGKIAAVRNKVLEAIKDGKISTEQFEKIVSEISNNSKRWTKNNSKYFTISEDGISLSNIGRKVLSSITVNEADYKEFPKGSNPEIWVPGNFEKDISKYSSAKLNRKIVLDAAKKWDVKPEDAIKYVEFGWSVDLSENNNNNMKAKFIYESFTEFVENKLNENTLNEAFASLKLASLLTGGNAMPRDLPKAFYNMSKLALDKIQDVDIIEMDPQTAKKEKRNNAVYLYFTTNEKSNPYAGKFSYNSGTIPANTLLAITDGSNEWMNAEWNASNGRRQSQKDGRVLTTTSRGDSAGIGKSGASDEYGTGISSMKQVAELADRAYCLDLDILKARYSTSALKAEREVARKGATAMMDPRTFKDANKARYNEILAQKASAMPIDAIVLDAIEAISTQIKDALAKGEKGRYGEIILGVNPKGREVKLTDAAYFMRSILDQYQSYVGDVAESEKEVTAGYGTSYYENSLKQRSKSIIDDVKKIESKNYAW